MSVAGAVYLTGGWIVFGLDPSRSWVCLILFGMAILAMIVDGLEGR